MFIEFFFLFYVYKLCKNICKILLILIIFFYIIQNDKTFHGN